MNVTFRPIDQWPGALRADHARAGSPFRAGWSDTLELLDRELRHLQAKHVVIQLALREGDIRIDGMPRANARDPEHPGAILAFDSKYGPLKYATDAYRNGWGSNSAGWKANVRAIGLGLEALRKVDRYGITKRGEQYTGWKELPAGGLAMGPGLTADEAAKFISEHSIESPLNGRRIATSSEVLTDPSKRQMAYRVAARNLHPDTGGDPAEFARLADARRVLEGV